VDGRLEQRQPRSVDFLRDTNGRARGRRRRLDGRVLRRRVRRSRFVVLTAHRLVYVGDVITRHVTNQSVGEQFAVAANELCGQRHLFVMTTKNVALATDELSCGTGSKRESTAFSRQKRQRPVRWLMSSGSPSCRPLTRRRHGDTRRWREDSPRLPRNVTRSSVTLS